MAGWHLPSLSESLRVRRFRWPLFVLLASIGLTAIAAMEAQRTVRSQRTVAERALREYASFAAWSYAQHLVDTLNLIERESVGAVNHGMNMHTNPEVPAARELAHYLPMNEECMCHRALSGVNPDAFFAIKIGSNAFDVGVNTHPDAADGWEVDRPLAMSMSMPASLDRTYDPLERRWLLDSLTRRVRRLGEPDHGFTLVVGHVANQPRFFAYTLMPTSWGDTMVYGARYSNATFVRVLEGVLDGSGLLPATFTEGRRNRDVVAVRIRDRAGNTLFDSAPGVTSPLDAHVDLPARAGLLGVDAVIRPELAGALLIGGLPASRLPFLFGLLGLAAALSIVAVMQLRREGELAHLRGDFVSSVSHELRTPVAQIRLYLETLQLGRASTDKQRAWSLAHIERETTRLAHLVENVLRFSSLGRDDPTLREPTDVTAEVSRIVDEYRPLAASRRATMCVTAEPTPSMSLRPDALRHIVLNLVDNAVKYGPAGQTVRVGVGTRANDVVITVDDQGPGVARADRDRIWRAFTRGRAAQSNGGSGIGLTIVREVAEAHGGSARVEESAGGGARFVVALPVDPPVDPPAGWPA
ncbi:MAG: ATP-binding region ATPase domain protein [Gemmatimonadetes bacterium]|nr:ATP-binding region ATPase domain protein [Gemmatimonadota bacterium]